MPPKWLTSTEWKASFGLEVPLSCCVSAAERTAVMNQVRSKLTTGNFLFPPTCLLVLHIRKKNSGKTGKTRGRGLHPAGFIRQLNYSARNFSVFEHPSLQEWSDRGEIIAAHICPKVSLGNVWSANSWRQVGNIELLCEFGKSSLLHRN